MKINKTVYILSFLLGFFILTTCEEINTTKTNVYPDEILLQKAKAYFTPIPTPILSEKSKKDKIKIIIGKKLFMDSILSFNQTKSCNSCHPIDQFGMDNNRVSKGDSNREGLRNTPSVFNSSLQYAQFWDARAKTLEEQALGPIFGKNEMGMKDTFEVIKRVAFNDEYRYLFEKAYPDKDTSLTISHLAECIAEFEKTLITSNDKFDRFLKGDKGILNAQEKRGLSKFIDNGCIPCHSGPLLGGNMAQKFAIYGYYWDYTGSNHLDKGMYQHSKESEDKFVFKVPGLRNVAKTGPYFHDGSVESIEEAIDIMARAELNTNLSQEDIDDIASFLKTLTGTLKE